MRRTLFFPLAVILSLCASACDREKDAESAPPLVRFAVAFPEHVVLTSRLPGRVSALEVSEVRPQVDGIIQERLFEEGAQVEQGQVLYRIDAARYQAAYNTAAAELAEAEAAVTALERQEKRRRNLSRENAVSRQDLDNAISEHGQAKARIARAKAALETAAINLAYTEIRAPITGRIGKSSVTPGALVTAHQANPLAVIRQTDRVYVDITQSSAEALRVRRALTEGKLSCGNAPGVLLTLEDGSVYASLKKNGTDTPAPIYGTLLFSEMAVSRTTGAVLLRAVFDNPDGLLLPGMYVTATVEEGVRERVVLAPQGCILPGNAGGHFVYVLKEQQDWFFTAEHRPVRLGRRVGNRRIIEEGLWPGEKYVVEGLQHTTPGGTVKGEIARPASESR